METYRHTSIHKYNIQAYRHADIQAHGDTSIEKDRHPCIPTYRDTNAESYEHTGTPLEHTDIQACRV